MQTVIMLVYCRMLKNIFKIRITLSSRQYNDVNIPYNNTNISYWEKHTNGLIFFLKTFKDVYKICRDFQIKTWKKIVTLCVIADYLVSFEYFAIHTSPAYMFLMI